MQVHLPFPLHPALASMYGSHFMEKYVADDTLDPDADDTLDSVADDTLGHGADYSLEILVMVKFLKHTNQNYLIYTDFKNNVKFQTRLDLGCVPL